MLLRKKKKCGVDLMESFFFLVGKDMFKRFKAKNAGFSTNFPSPLTASVHEYRLSLMLLSDLGKVIKSLP